MSKKPDYGTYQQAIESNVFKLTKQDKKAVRDVVREEKKGGKR